MNVAAWSRNGARALDGTRRQQVGTIFDYSFSAWPDETWDFDRAVYDLFRMLGGRVEMTFTPDEFEKFRSALSRHGLTLREADAFHTLSLNPSHDVQFAASLTLRPELGPGGRRIAVSIP